MISIPGEEVLIDIAKGIGIDLALSYIKKIISWFKRKISRKKVLFPSDQKKTKEIVESLDNDTLKENPLTIQLVGDYNIINIGGKYGFVSKKDSENDIIKTLNELKKGGSTKKINLIPIEKSEEYIDFKEKPKFIDKEIESIINSLDVNLKSLIGLSIFIEDCYKNDLTGKAEELKNDIRNRYTDVGLKIVNLWSRGYLKNLFRFLSQKLAQGAILPLDINSRVLDFIEKSESIFFIHAGSDINKTAAEVSIRLAMGKDYVAVHSIGLKKKAKKIIKKIKVPEKSNYTTVSVEKEVYLGKEEVSRIWYKDSGQNTYFLSKDIIL